MSRQGARQWKTYKGHPITLAFFGVSSSFTASRSLSYRAVKNRSRPPQTKLVLYFDGAFEEVLHVSDRHLVDEVST